MNSNVAMSIRDRLLRLSKQRNEDFNFILRQYLIQRLLYRLSISDYSEQFLLKGALLFWVWTNNYHRPTIDIDLLGFGKHNTSDSLEIFKKVCEISYADGLDFDLASIVAVEIKENEKYQGVRIKGKANLAKANIPFQIDIGFGDAVNPKPSYETVPVFLDLPSPKLKIYPIYSVVSEKFHAMVKLDLANSRIKDFYDIWVISCKDLNLIAKTLSDSIKATFERRETPITSEPLFLFTDEFKSDETKQIQWQAFCRKNRLECELSFFQLMSEIQSFLEPIYYGIILNNNTRTKLWYSKQWRAESTN